MVKVFTKTYFNLVLTNLKCFVTPSRTQIKIWTQKAYKSKEWANLTKKLDYNNVKPSQKYNAFTYILVNMITSLEEEENINSYGMWKGKGEVYIRVYLLDLHLKSRSISS